MYLSLRLMSLGAAILTGILTTGISSKSIASNEDSVDKSLATFFEKESKDSPRSFLFCVSHEKNSVGIKRDYGDIYSNRVSMYWLKDCKQDFTLFPRLTNLVAVKKEWGVGPEYTELERLFLLVLNGASHWISTMHNATYFAQQLVDSNEAFNPKFARDLTSRLGVKFTQDVFREWLRLKFGMDSTLDDASNTIRQLQQGGLRDKPALSLKKPVLYIVNGQGGHNTDLMVQLMKQSAETLYGKDIDVRYALRDEVGELEKNSLLLKEQYRDVLMSGRDLYLIQMSKGAQESLRAITYLAREFSSVSGIQRWPSGWGTIKVSMNIVPLFTGSFLSDFASSQGWMMWLINKIETMRSSYGENWNSGIQQAIKYVVSGVKLNTREIESAQNLLKDDYPSDLPQLNLTFFPIDGIYKSQQPFHPSSVAQFVYRKLGIVKTGHDNLIEVGGCVFPFEKNKSRYIYLDGTHMLNDLNMNVDGVRYDILDPNRGPLLAQALFLSFMKMQDM